MLLIICLCGGLFCFPAQAEEATDGNAADVVDIVTIPLSTKGMAALMADGTVRTAGLESYFDAETIAEIEAWTDLVQLDASMGDYFGLKADGSVVSTMHDDTLTDPFDPNHWTNVKELLANEYGYFALTKDGRVLVWNDYPDASFGGGKVYQSWTKVEKLCYYAYPEARGMCGLRADGTFLRPSDFYAFHGKASKLVDIGSSGYICCGLRSDGTVTATGDNSGGQCEVSDWTEIKIEAKDAGRGRFFGYLPRYIGHRDPAECVLSLRSAPDSAEDQGNVRYRSV